MELRECPQPWMEIQYIYSGYVRTCCYHIHPGEKIEELSGASPSEVFNSGIFTDLRKIIAENTHQKGYCEECYGLKFRHASFFSSIKEGIGEKQRKNWEKALESFNNKEIVVDHYPVLSYFDFSLECNLRCFFCSQQHQREEFKGKRLDFEELKKNKDLFTSSAYLTIIGGEPLIIPDAVKFIKWVASEKDFDGTTLRIITNGTQIDRMMDTFEKLPRIQMGVSLEAVGENYDKLRLGASWEHTKNNVLKFKERGEEKGYHWTIGFSMVFLKSTFYTLEELVRFCVENDIEFIVSPVFTVDDYTKEHEDVFNRPELLKDVPGWKDILENSIAMIKDKNWENADFQLKNILNILTEKTQTDKNTE